MIGFQIIRTWKYFSNFFVDFGSVFEIHQDLIGDTNIFARFGTQHAASQYVTRSYT